MIILDESRLTYETIMSIGKDYEMGNDKDAIINRFKFNLDEFKEKLVSAVMNGIKIELKLK